MNYKEVVIKVEVVTDKGDFKEKKEKYLVKDTILCGEAENKVLAYCNNQGNVVQIKDSSIVDFINERQNEEQFIFVVAIETSLCDDDTENEKVVKSNVGLFATSLAEATDLAMDYTSHNTIQDETIVSVKKTKFIDVLF